MSKHTPGPWTVSSLAREGTRNTYVIDHAMSGVFTIEDANLIAAAPEMFDALRAMVDRWEPDCIGTDRVMWENAVAALAKAEGRS